MARRTSRTGYDLSKFENVQQVGGIQVAALHPGSSEQTRVAIVNTGSGLRFTVALDRGGDIVDASFNQHSVTYLTPVGIHPPNAAYSVEDGWLANWSGGLLTSCGPQYIGHPRDEDGQRVNLHGHHSNTPANVEMLINPDPHMGRNEMLISMTIRDARMFGPVVEVRRQIQCVLGQPIIHLYDQVTNRGNNRCAHHWLYHTNFGYPLLDAGARFIYAGKAEYWTFPDPPKKKPTSAELAKLKVVTNAIEAHRSGGERGLTITPKADSDGNAHVGIINEKLGLGVEMTYPVKAMPRVANWQHYGPDGCYVTGIEPFSGSLFGKDGDSFRGAEQYLKPGETKRYRMTLQVHSDEKSLKAFAKRDGRLTSL